MALWANAQIPARGFVRIAYFTPTMLPMIAAANIWLFFYTPGLGVLDQIGALFGLPSVNWLGQPETALWAVHHRDDLEGGRVLHDLLPGRAADHPRGPKEAADIEGAEPLDLHPPRHLAAADADDAVHPVNAVINSFKLIDHLFILTKGGPVRRLQLMLYYICEMAFGFFDAPHAAALTMLVLAALGIVAVGPVRRPRQADPLPMSPAAQRFADSLARACCWPCCGSAADLRLLGGFHPTSDATNFDRRRR